MEKIDICFTPPTLAKHWGVKPETVIDFIRSGELRAFDVSKRPGVGKPRFRISPAAVIEFENRRSVSAPTRTRKRGKKKGGEIIEFF